MRTVKTLKPGQKGTKEMVTRFGQSLVSPRKPESLRFRLFGPAPPAQETLLEDSDGLQAVRYRYDEARREHVKTVELVVQRRSREGEAECSGSRTSGARAPGARSVRSGGVTTRRVARDVRKPTVSPLFFSLPSSTKPLRPTSNPSLLNRLTLFPSIPYDTAPPRAAGLPTRASRVHLATLLRQEASTPRGMLVEPIPLTWSQIPAATKRAQDPRTGLP